MAAAIIDVRGRVLAAARWQRVCTDFHRVNPITCARCIESDTSLSGHLQEGKNYTIYRCQNGLTDAASPIMVNGQHIANVFIGQFLLAPPDKDFFSAQARRVGFDEADYLAAIAEAPIIAEEKLPSILGFLSRFSNLLATLSMERMLTTTAQTAMRQGKLAALNLAEDTELARKELSAYKDQLEEMVAERTQALRVSEERMRSIIENAADGIVVIGPDGIVQSFSPAAERIFGYAASEVIGHNVSQLMPEPMADEHNSYINRYLTSGEPRVVGSNRETVGRHKDGHEFSMDLAVGEATLGDERIFTGIIRDI
ncbi:MAG: PocR ligand-binding domain-containing protein, partial [Alphaproteobacteria bacterium]